MIRHREDATFVERAVGFAVLTAGVFAWIGVTVGAGRGAGLLAAGAGGAAYWAWRWAVGRRIRINVRLNRGQCVGCGFDLRESTGVCPECGVPVPPCHRTQSDVLAALEKMR